MGTTKIKVMMIWWIISVLPQQIPSWYSWKTKGMTQKNPKMQTLKSLNYMMKLYHVTENNRIYLTDMIVVNHNLLFGVIFDCVRGQGKPFVTQFYLAILVRNIIYASRF